MQDIWLREREGGGREEETYYDDIDGDIDRRNTW
jgi:hypothetical protein